MNDCWVELYLLSETQLATKQKSAGYIRSKNSFKSYEYLLSVTENRTNLKIPLMAIVHYKGIAAMVVSKTEMQLKSIKMRDGMEKLNR